MAIIDPVSVLSAVAALVPAEEQVIMRVTATLPQPPTQVTRNQK